MGLTEDMKNDPALFERYRDIGRKIYVIDTIDRLIAERPVVAALKTITSESVAKRLVEIDQRLMGCYKELERLHLKRPELIAMDPRTFPRKTYDKKPEEVLAPVECDSAV